MISDTLFTYTLDNGIHHITALHSTREAVEEMLKHVEGLFEGIPAAEKVRVLLDFHRVATPPISEWLVPILAFFRRPGPKTRHPARVAYIYASTARGRILSGFLSIQRFLPQRVILRFFSEAERDKALEWLHLA